MSGPVDDLRARLTAALDALNRAEAFMSDLRAMNLPVTLKIDGAGLDVAVNITVVADGRHARPADTQPDAPLAPEPDRSQTGAGSEPCLNKAEVKPKPAARRFGPWTDLERDRLKKMHRAGASVAEISTALNRAPQAVGSFVQRLEQRHAEPDVAVAPGPKAPVPLPSIAPFVRDQACGWTVKDDITLVEELSLGRSLLATAEKITRTPDVCKKRFSVLLPKPSFEAQAKLLLALKAEAAAL